MVDDQANYISFIGLESSKVYGTRPGGDGGMWEELFGCEFFKVGQCVQREWVVGGGGLYGYFGEQRLPVGVQECLDIRHSHYLHTFKSFFLKIC